MRKGSSQVAGKVGQWVENWAEWLVERWAAWMVALKANQMAEHLVPWRDMLLAAKKGDEKVES